MDEKKLEQFMRTIKQIENPELIFYGITIFEEIERRFNDKQKE